MSNTQGMSAKERILSLLDESSFVETGALVTKRNTDFNMMEKSVPSDGVITGYGLIQDRPVYVYSQDAAALAGSIGEMHAKKIVAVYEMAMKVGVPVIGLIDCAGLRLQEATDALAGFGEIYKVKADASGVIPQISAVFGSCGGGVAVMTALSDYTFMEAGNAKFFVNSPNALAGNYTEKCDTASAACQAANGMVDFVGENEEDVLNQVRTLFGLLPDNNAQAAMGADTEDDLNRLVSGFGCGDASISLADISDGNVFVEVQAAYAKEMVTGFITLDGMTVGAVANRTELLDAEGKSAETYEARLTTAGCRKAASFVKKCDAFNIPVLTLTNTEGYAATVEEEASVGRAAAELTYAFTQADVPKVNVITGNAYGSAYVTMNSKHIGADMVFALSDAKIGMMDAGLAAKVMYADDREVDMEKIASEYEKVQSGAGAAAKRGYVDAVINAADARKQLVYAFGMLSSKSGYPLAKKHGTV